MMLGLTVMVSLASQARTCHRNIACSIYDGQAKKKMTPTFISMTSRFQVHVADLDIGDTEGWT